MSKVAHFLLKPPTLLSYNVGWLLAPIRVAFAEKEKAQAERDVTYWKEEVKKALHWQVEWQHERKRREELKVRITVS